MANLIPLNARKRVKVEYWMRVASVWMFLIGGAIMLVAFLQIPVYVLVNNQLQVFNDWHEEVSATNEEFKKSEEVIRQANRVNALLSAGDNQTFSLLIEEIESIASDEIYIESFNMVRKDGVVDELVINGEAATRSGLAAFRNEIEGSEYFEAAALPISNLAKDTEIPFNITITVANNEEDV